VKECGVFTMKRTVTRINKEVSQDTVKPYKHLQVRMEYVMFTVSNGVLKSTMVWMYVGIVY
jgi:hypothetical protein